VDVGVLELQGSAAGIACVAGPFGARSLAEEELSCPESESLLPYALLPMEEEGGGKISGEERTGDRLPWDLVPFKRVKHGLPHLGRSQRIGSIA
jgi:hypothetical protein